MPKPKTAPNPSKPLKLNPICKKEGTLLAVRSFGSKGGMDVVARKSDETEWWYLLRFNPDGTLMRQEAVPSSLGFQLDTKGRIVLDDGDNS